MKTMLYFLKLIFGRDTRSLQMLNLYCHLVWFSMVLTYFVDTSKVRFISGVVEHLETFTIMLVLVIACAVLSLVSKGERKQILKVFSLLLGSVIQGIISSGYVKAYPPLDTMSIFCISLCFWFAGAALYVIKMEGFNNGVKLYNPTSYRK